MAVRFWKWQEIFFESVKIFCEMIENWNFHRKSCNFRGRDYRTFAENFLAKSQDTRKSRIISRSVYELNELDELGELDELDERDTRKTRQTSQTRRIGQTRQTQRHGKMLTLIRRKEEVIAKCIV